MTIIDTAMAAALPAMMHSFGETVSYTPAGGEAREITAAVRRQPPGPVEGMPAGRGPQLTIAVANDATTGISSSELDTGGDTVTVAVRVGQTPKVRAIVGIVSHNAAQMVLELR